MHPKREEHLIGVLSLVPPSHRIFQLLNSMTNMSVSQLIKSHIGKL